MRKLLQQVFAVWTTNRPYDPDAYPHRKAQEQAEASDKARAESKAAGRNKGQSPRRKAVTAASVSIDANQLSVKQTLDSQEPSSSQTPALINFAALRQQVTMEQVLNRLGHFDRLIGSGPQRRGPCPLHADEHSRGRSFSVNLDKNVCQCFHPPCSLKGNVLDLWAHYHRLPLREAALNLAETFSLDTSQTEKTEKSDCLESQGEISYNELPPGGFVGDHCVQYCEEFSHARGLRNFGWFACV